MRLSGGGWNQGLLAQRQHAVTHHEVAIWANVFVNGGPLPSYTAQACL